MTLNYGDTVTCVFENTAPCTTRTQGFWATHLQLAHAAWFGGTAGGHTFPGVASVAGIGDKTDLRPSDRHRRQAHGRLLVRISKTSTGDKRSSIDQARMQLLQQLIAAELNASAFGSTPTYWVVRRVGIGATAATNLNADQDRRVTGSRLQRGAAIAAPSRQGHPPIRRQRRRRPQKQGIGSGTSSP